ncbi:unnamed protein product [Adineta steineri]|uniref:RUN domain-containing protein n=1 Tax=Adineta steineri TaxID=433720 RepID=A0A815C498_9BILA|nr:unnamed protein product [Adineta steineri]CAF3627523.1 unnamed protein product [Adineta steineri]
MLNPYYETTLVSQLLDSINDHLKIIHSPQMKQQESSIDNDDDDDDLWLSGHRSIFSSYGSPCRKIKSSFHESQYDGFHWDLYGNQNYHHLAFEYDQQNICPPAHLSEWSMHLDSDNIDDTALPLNTRQTSWQTIKTKSINLSCSSTNTSNSDYYSPNPLTLYHLFQRTKSQQHPCRLYENFSDKSLCDSLTSSSSSSSSSNSRKIPIRKIKLKSPTTFSQLNLINSKQIQSKSNVDQCLQTSLILCDKTQASVTHSESTDHLLNHPPSQSSFISHYSLPDLDFLTYYAKENPPQLSTLTNQTKSICTPMKTILSEPLSDIKKPTRTVFYCNIKLPNRPSTYHHSTLSKNKFAKSNPTTISADENETLSSSVCSSTSSSGYFSNCSTNQTRHIQTPLSSCPLKSCLKRTKIEETTRANVLAVGIAGDIFTLASERIHNKNDRSEHRRYSAPTTISQQENLSLETKTCTLSEHDLSAKKSVSFSNEITRKLITPSSSPKYHYDDYYDLIPRESLTDSPPSEFNFSDDDDDEVEEHLVNFIEDTSPDVIKPLPIKKGSDKYLIDIFSNTILRILEIKCSDSKSYYLNNQTNPELDRTLRLDFCPLLREVLEDGLRQHAGSLFSRKVNLWRLIDLTTPATSRFNEIKMKVQLELSSNIDWIEKFNSFIYHLLNLHELTSWLTHFFLHRTILKTYYESWAFVLVNANNDLFESITNQLEKLSPLPFHLKYNNLTNSKILLTNQRLSTSIIPKKFNVRSWLRDRKTQVKISPKETTSSILPNIYLRRKFHSNSNIKIT